jgi:hypothetical protein
MCRQATEQLLRDHLGFFAGFFQAAVQSMASTVEGTGSDLRVGKRKRSSRWNQRNEGGLRTAGYVDGGADYFMVPPERALVPITVYAQLED